MKDKFNFWDEICGTLPFRRLGLKKITPYSLEVFDTWYFNHYPYLKKYFSKDSLIPFATNSSPTKKNTTIKDIKK